MKHWFFATSLMAATSAFAADITVKPGDDIRTLTASLGAGSTIIFSDGEYVIDGELRWSGIGTETQPIVLKAATGAKPVIQLTAGSRVAYILDSEWIVVDGLTFEGSTEYFDSGSYNGMRIDNSKHVKVKNCEMRQVSSTVLYLYGNNEDITLERNHLFNSRDGSGIYAGCSDAACWTFNSRIANNWIHDLGGQNSNGISITNGGYNNEIVDNVVYNSPRNGITTASTEKSDQNIVEGNVVWGAVQHGFVISGAAIVRNNIAFSVGGSAFYSDNARDNLEKLVVSSNTFADSGDYTVRLRNWDGAEGMVFANNAVTNPVGRAMRVDESSTSEDIYYSHNVITGLVTGLNVEEGGFFMGGGVSDYLDWENWEFYPSQTSSFIDAGEAAPEGGQNLAWVPVLDFNGQSRDGSAPDVGAFEWVNYKNPGWRVKEGFKEQENNLFDNENQVGGCGKNTDDASDAWVLLFPLVALGWRGRRRQSV